MREACQIVGYFEFFMMVVIEDDPTSFASGSRESRQLICIRATKMPELHEIAADLRRQRKDLDELLESTASRSGQTVELIGKIEELRKRSEKTRLQFEAARRAKDLE